MGKFDGILNAFKNNNDDSDYSDDDYEGYEDSEYEAPVRNKGSRKNSDASEDYEEPKKKGTSFWTTGKTAYKNTKKGTENMEVSIYYPKSLDAATAIVDSLLEQKSVIMNLEGIDMEIAQRIFDFITGATYALNGRLEKISKYVYVVTPQNVNISGDNNPDDPAVPIGKEFPV